jgi:hypothetical protein
MTSNPGVFTMRDFLGSALERMFNPPASSRLSSGSALVSPSQTSLATATTLPPSTPTVNAPVLQPQATGVIPLALSHDPFPAIVPTVFSLTSQDAAGGIVQAATGSQGGNPMTSGFSSTGIRYADGGHAAQHD